MAPHALSGIRAALRSSVSGVARRLDPERLGRLEPVVRREPLVGPAIGQQRAVEPGVRRLVEDDEVVGVVGDLDGARGRVEQAGVAAGRTADRLAHGQAAVARPRHPDLLREDRQPLDHQVADALRPCRVVRPRLDRQRDRVRPDVGAGLPIDVRARPIGHEIGEEGQRRRELAGLEGGDAVGADGRLRDLARLDLDLVAGREDDPDRASGRRVGRKGPDRERRQRRPDPEVTGRGPARVDHVEDEPVCRRLAAVEPRREVELEERVGRGLLRDLRPRRPRTRPGQLEARRVGQDRQEGSVEIEPFGGRVVEVVGHGHVDRDPDPMLRGLHVVAGAGDDRQIRGRATDLGHTLRHGEQSGRGHDGEQESGQATAHGSSSSGRRVV